MVATTAPSVLKKTIDINVSELKIAYFSIEKNGKTILLVRNSQTYELQKPYWNQWIPQLSMFDVWFGSQYGETFMTVKSHRMSHIAFRESFPPGGDRYHRASSAIEGLILNGQVESYVEKLVKLQQKLYESVELVDEPVIVAVVH